MVVSSAFRQGAARVAEKFHGQLNRSSKLYLWYRLYLPSERRGSHETSRSPTCFSFCAISYDYLVFEFLFGELFKYSRALAAKRIIAVVAPAAASRLTTVGNLLHGVSTQHSPTP
ncbi:hypothetical protein BKA82DRAFT_991221 [Pisolithus tinctorius]|uniref:Uncharacterized protein n=1 Tax=Pisolithus tinctorius Marx 270 TaxID=870435 RepID=A0A0C3PYV9_PISTI|nr:hypothetical protein BKA82DRAFT_991221 [Pisolithus tinctorius]KIO14469.1 hypothetical protein M404DRAFT_991221 [Pisolithus tinctorius Marx 270]